ncbi:FAD-dependent oxidoreductase [Methylobacterium sp. Leaf85]|uniref:FAD-dependent oxidoreductase n=1 Tax=Methylobacterium sp. Leaf85 TaxID=1736241 RepID=UPI0006F9C266|nr:FAD-dependent oxidoreductase [Methylobacterium sp. Leaf85]KQO51699.1 hypothetical protein ASF08_02890 [Methylobacterium sp. Leaf85]
MAIINTNIFCYGATQAGMAFAAYAVETGARCLIGEWTRHIGGTSAGGLGIGDWSTARWGKTKQVNVKIGENLGFTDGREMKNVSANQMRASMDAVYLANQLIEIRTNMRLKKVYKHPGTARISMVELESGDLIVADYFHDASYEYDLARLAGVRLRSGREGQAQFNAPVEYEDRDGKMSTPGWNPLRHKNENHTLIDTRGDRFWFATQAPQRGLNNGDATAANQANGWRFELLLRAKGEPGGLPWVKPSDWTQADDRRILDLIYRSQSPNNPSSTGAGGNLFPFGGSARAIDTTVAHQSGRYGTNGCDLPGAFTNGWCDASYGERVRIAERAAWITMGSHWVTANHPDVAKRRRESIQRLRLPEDTFQEIYTLFPGWPPQFYIRDGGGIWGQFMMTAEHLRKNPATRRPWNFEDSVTTGGYHADIHTPYYYNTPDGYARKEGSIGYRERPNYGVPLRCFLPHPGQCSNLTVSWGASGDAIWRSSWRMEQTVACGAQSCGMLTALAFNNGSLSDRALADVPFPELKARLAAENAVTTV